MLARVIAAWPLPPADILARGTNHAAQTVLTILIAGGVLTVYAAAFRMRQRFGTWIPLAVVLGSTFSALIEPLPDAVANLWYFTPGQTSIYSAYGNSLPIWTWLSYTVYYGGVGMLLWYLIEKGATRKRIATICVPVAIYMGAGELVFTNALHLYTYYGPAAFVVDHYPVWIPLLNTSIVLGIGSGMARLRRNAGTRDQLFPAFLLPSVSTVLGLLVEPVAVWTVIHGSNPSKGLVYVATVSAIVLALGAIYTWIRMFPAEGFTPMEPVSAPAIAASEPVARPNLVAQES